MRVTQSNLVAYLESLPDVYFEEYGIRLEFNHDDDFVKLINGMRFQYKAISKWLRYYLLGESYLKDELQREPLAYYKPLAEQYMAFYKLAQEVRLLTSFDRRVDAELIMIAIIHDTCEAQLKNVGLIDVAKPLAKQEIYSGFIKLVRVLDTIENTGQLSPYAQQDKKRPSAMVFLIDAAIRISQIKENTKFRARYRDFKNQISRCNRELRDSPLQMGYLSPGLDLKISGDGKRGKGKKKNLC